MMRRGGILIEAVVAMMLLSLLTLSTGKALSLMNRQSRFLSQRAVALQECHIALAKVAEIKATQWNAEKLATITLPAEAAETLPDGALKVTQQTSVDGEEGSRLRAAVTWRPAPGADPASVELSIWRFDLPATGPTQGAAP